MIVSPHNLATALATRLNELLPTGCRLAPLNHDPWLELYIEGAFDTTLSAIGRIGGEPRDVERRLESAIYYVLDSIQDSVMEHWRTPWPSTDGRSVALPRVRVTTNSIHLWYDSNEAPLIAIPEIPLSEIAISQ